MTGLLVSMLAAGIAQQADTAKPQKIRVAPNVMIAQLTHRVDPQYPEDAKAQGISGTVAIRLAIDKEGHVVQAEILSGPPLLVQPAIDAVKQWEFKPYLVNGEPVEVETTVNVYVGVPRRLRVSQGVSEGNLLHKVNPVYPPEARAKHIQGEVILQATISKDGKIIHVAAVTGEPLLAQASIEAVQQWQYRPYLLDGNPVEVETTLRIVFRM